MIVKTYIMKIRILISTIVTILLSNTGFSQNMVNLQVNIGGLILERTYSHAEVIAIMGEPLNYEHLINSESYESSDVRIYTYGNNKFIIEDNIFDIFVLKDTIYKINGIFGVGDFVSKIYELPHNNIIHTPEQAGPEIYLILFRGEEEDKSPMYITVVNGIIVKINFFVDNL